MPPSPPMCTYVVGGQGSGETPTVALTTTVATATQCYLTVDVQNTDFDGADEYVNTTTANGVEIHGRCSPSDGAVVDGRGFFRCAERAALPYAADGVYTIETRASDEVDETLDGDYVFVDYAIICAGLQCSGPGMPPSPLAPPSSPPLAPPPLPLPSQSRLPRSLRSKLHLGSVSSQRCVSMLTRF